MTAEHWVWIVAGIIVLMTLVALAKWIRLFVLAFALCFAALLLLHMRANPGEGAGVLLAMGGGMVVASRLRLLVFRGFL